MKPRKVLLIAAILFAVLALFSVFVSGSDVWYYLLTASAIFVLSDIVRARGNRWRNAPAELSNEGAAEVRELTAAGREREAVTRYRELTGAGLEEAEVYVEGLEHYDA